MKNTFRMKKMFDKVVSMFRKGGNKERVSDEDMLLLLRKVEVVDKLIDKGYLYVDRRCRRAVIGSTVANLFLSGKKRWEAFLQSVWCWIVYTESKERWGKAMLDAEVAAIRRARKKYASLSRAQEADIRMDARSSVDISACKAPEIASFEFVLTSDALASSDAPEVLSVGKYVNGEFEIVPYEEIARRNGHGEAG